MFFSFIFQYTVILCFIIKSYKNEFFIIILLVDKGHSFTKGILVDLRKVRRC